MWNSLTIKFVLIMCLVSPANPFSARAETEITKLSLGGSGITGPYFPTAGTIAKAVNRKRGDHGIRITVKSRRGSVSVIEAVAAGDFEFGVVQVRRIHQAYHGSAEWEGKPRKGLRSVLNIHPQQLALVVSEKSNIRAITDLKGRRVFIGAPHSDLRHAVMDILSAFDMDPQSEMTVTGTVSEEAHDLMQEAEIDALFHVMGVMSRSFIDLVSGPRKMRLVPIAGLGVKKLTAVHPYYEQSIVSIANYPYFQNPSDIKTVGVKAGLVTSARIPDRIVSVVAEAVFADIDRFRNLHPKAAMLTRSQMAADMAAPVHPGAADFYKTSGIGFNAVTP